MLYIYIYTNIFWHSFWHLFRHLFWHTFWVQSTESSLPHGAGRRWRGKGRSCIFRDPGCHGWIHIPTLNLGILTWQVGKKMDGVLWFAELGESLHCLDTFWLSLVVVLTACWPTEKDKLCKLQPRLRHLTPLGISSESWKGWAPIEPQNC